MPIKLLEKGKRLDFKWAGECRLCGSKFEITNREVLLEGVQVHSDQREGEWIKHDCSECNSQVFLYRRDKAPSWPS